MLRSKFLTTRSVSLALLATVMIIILCWDDNKVRAATLRTRKAMEEEVPKVGCSRCGDSCKRSCGTRLFRPCCLHFVKKRIDQLQLNESENYESEMEKTYGYDSFENIVNSSGTDYTDQPTTDFEYYP
ncbi:unnamed protein product [Allacma fusca]|uniref:Uncharacterized protein n=1 Tax=Allacma fusca TaxID=39272 RepID=A0A8J2JTM8_9HEXA|nr:unnamed protein product [Allacma fusca]